jgi:hypothetical protein
MSKIQLKFQKLSNDPNHPISTKSMWIQEEDFDYKVNLYTNLGWELVEPIPTQEQTIQQTITTTPPPEIIESKAEEIQKEISTPTTTTQEPIIMSSPTTTNPLSEVGLLLGLMLIGD